MGNQEMRAKPDTNFDFLRGFFGKGGFRNRSMPTPLSFEMPDVNQVELCVTARSAGCDTPLIYDSLPSPSFIFSSGFSDSVSDAPE